MADMEFGVGQTVVIEDPTVAVEFDPPTAPGIVVLPVPGPRGADGAAGNRYYLHAQTSPAAEWLVVHGFGERPQVSVLVDNEVIGVPVEHVDDNTVFIQFAQPETGEVICS